MKVNPHTKNESNNDFIRLLKKEWKKMPSPKQSLGSFLKEYFLTEKELYDFLKINKFLLENDCKADKPTNTDSEQTPEN